MCAAGSPYPLLLQPVLLEKVWGGSRLAQLGKAVSEGKKIGEAWELADMDATSASGAGGGAIRSVVVNGAFRGKTLREALGAWGDPLGGRAFPLLIKFLDARENLSVQVHPSPEYAAASVGANLKTECWYIIHAEPGAVIYKGIKPEVTRARFEALARANDPGIVDAMIAVPAVPGEMHNLPSGTVHALGAGVLVAEVQTPSDTTFRVYDWGRIGRALHVQETLACAAFPGEPGYEPMQRGLTVASLKPGELCGRLVETPFFIVDECRPMDGDEMTIGYSCKARRSGTGGAPRGRCFVLIVLGGAGRLTARDGSFEPLEVNTGDTVLVPSAVSGAAVLHAQRDLRVLRVGVLAGTSSALG